MQIYKYKDPPEVLKSLSLSLNNEPQPSYFGALFNSRHKITTAINIFLQLFHEMTGIITIKGYSNTLLKSENFSVRTGSIMITIVYLIGTLVAIKTVSKYGRKFLL